MVLTRIRIASALAIFLGINPAYALDSADTHISKGDGYMSSQKLIPAKGEFEKAVSLEPDNARAHQRLGAVLGALDQYDDAIKEEKTAMKLDSKLAIPHIILGQIYANQGHTDLAVEEFQQS